MLNGENWRSQPKRSDRPAEARADAGLLLSQRRTEGNQTCVDIQSVAEMNDFEGLERENLKLKDLTTWAKERNIPVFIEPEEAIKEKEFVSIFKPGLHRLTHSQVFILFDGGRKEMFVRDDGSVLFKHEDYSP